MSRFKWYRKWRKGTWRLGYHKHYHFTQWFKDEELGSEYVIEKTEKY